MKTGTTNGCVDYLSCTCKNTDQFEVRIRSWHIDGPNNNTLGLPYLCLNKAVLYIICGDSGGGGSGGGG